jgi:hypothetical protein
MKKQKINVEYELCSNSESIIWPLISSSGGLQKWLADNVEDTDNGLKFTWGNEWSHQEKREADVVNVVKFKAIRFHWTDDEPEIYWEIRMEKNELTNSYILNVTDFADADDVESMYSLWSQNFEQLHQSTGL